MRRPGILAHRGASGYEYENSLAAFRRAVLLDADGVELDVHATLDGALVVHHDGILPGMGPIAQLSLDECRQARLRNGEQVPTLAEVLALLGNFEVWVEVKALPEEYDDRLLAALDAGPAPHRYGVHSFDHRIVARLGALRPTLRRGCLLSAYLLDPLAPLRDTGADTLWQEAHLIDQHLVALVHGAGCRLIAWTVNDIGDASRLAQLGVDALCGNYPDRLRAAAGPMVSVPSF